LGALKGNISYTRFFVKGEISNDIHERWVKRIRLRAFKPLTLEDDALDRVGWCSIEHPFDLELEYEKIFFNNYVNLGLRIDRWVIPGPLFKAQFAEAEKAYLQKRGRERMSRAEKEELKLAVSKKLRRQLVPAMQVIDMSWNIESGIARVFSGSQKALGAFEEIFEKTFELKVIPASPYTAAERRGLSARESQVIDRLEPSPFTSAFN
jgi:recombination associated protein RdgC